MVACMPCSSKTKRNIPPRGQCMPPNKWGQFLLTCLGCSVLLCIFPSQKEAGGARSIIEQWKMCFYKVTNVFFLSFFCGARAAQKGFYCINCFTFQWTVQLDPKFHEGASNLEQLVPFEECLQLHSTDTSVVQIPEYILVTNNGRSFKLVSFVYSTTTISFSFTFSSSDFSVVVH